MHYSNYISAREASRCIRDGARSVSLTPTALKQTRDTTIELLRKSGIDVREVKSSGRPRKLVKADIKRVIAIRHSGVSFYKISNLMQIPKSTVFDYCKRYDGAPVKEREIRDTSIEEAHRIFNELLEKDIDYEVNELAARGQKSEDTEEIEDILREIEIILYC
jgi:predicted transcriptional regulator